MLAGALESRTPVFHSYSSLDAGGLPFFSISGKPPTAEENKQPQNRRLEPRLATAQKGCRPVRLSPSVSVPVPVHLSLAPSRLVLSRLLGLVPHGLNLHKDILLAVRVVVSLSSALLLGGRLGCEPPGRPIAGLSRRRCRLLAGRRRPLTQRSDPVMTRLGALLED